MRRRIAYFLITVTVFVAIQLWLPPFLSDEIAMGTFDAAEANLIFMIVNFLVSIGLAIAIMIEGRQHKGLIVIGLLIIISRSIDAWRFAIFPEDTPEGNFFSLVTGGFIMVFAMTLFRDVVFQKSMAVPFALVGVFTFIRFPYFVDIIYYAYRGFGMIDEGATGYFNGIMFMFYGVLLFQVIGLDLLIWENVQTKRYAK